MNGGELKGLGSSDTDGSEKLKANGRIPFFFFVLEMMVEVGVWQEEGGIVVEVEV